MNTRFITRLWIVIVATVRISIIGMIISPIAVWMIACQPEARESLKPSTASTDTVVNSNTEPVESGHADLNGLKMYYEVYGEGDPLVLLHGSFMNIPLNWSHIIPRLSKGRKVIVAEMQGHGRTKDIPRELSYEGMADGHRAQWPELDACRPSSSSALITIQHEDRRLTKHTACGII